MCYIKKGIKRLICQIYRLLRNYTCTFRAEKFGDFLHNSKGGLGMIAIGADHGGYRLKEEIKKYFEENDVNYIDAKVGCTVGIHSGIKACGIFFIEK